MVDPCVVLTRSLAKKDMGMMHLVPGMRLTQMIGVIPLSVDEIGRSFGPVVAKIQKEGPCRFVVGDKFTKDQEKQIRRQFTQIFKGTRADLPGDGETHDEVVARLEQQSRALEKEGQGVTDGDSFFSDLFALHRYDDKVAAGEIKDPAEL